MNIGLVVCAIRAGITTTRWAGLEAMSLDAVTLIVSCVGWLAVAGALVATWVLKPRSLRTAGTRWIFAGLLVIGGGNIIGQVGQILLWPYGTRTVVDGIGLVLGVVVGGGCSIVGAIQVFRRANKGAPAGIPLPAPQNRA